MTMNSRVMIIQAAMWVLALLMSPLANGSDVTHIDVNLDMLHIVAGQNEFDRRRFITLHSSHTDQDWFGGNQASLGAPNASDDLMSDFLDRYDVYFGRDTGSMAWQLGRLPEDPQRRGFIDEKVAEEYGGGVRWNYTTVDTDDARRMRDAAARDQDQVVAAQIHPYWPDGAKTGQGWAFSTNDTPQEPFGTATGHYMANYLARYFNFGEGDPYGEKKPRYVEVINEPLYDLITDASDPVSPDKVFHFHNAVAAEIRKRNADVLIGGYTVAFPDFDKDNFERWERRDRRFIDIAGENMDFISLHFYDFPNFTGDGPRTQQYRKGSNLEATLDMLEEYSVLRLGALKPYVISEYGSQVHGLYDQPWSPYRDWLILKATNSMLMAFLERPHRIAKAIPFIPVKAEWGRNAPDIPYYWRLMRQAKEAEGESGEEWVFTDLVKFYQLWSEVRGKRVDTHSCDPDILVDAYVSDKDVYLIANNLELHPSTLNIGLFGAGSRNPVESVAVKYLSLVGDRPVLSENTLESLPDTFELAAEATAIFKIRFDDRITSNHTSEERTYYSTGFKQPIKAGESLVFDVPAFSAQEFGEAVLRVGIGRAHRLSLKPEININGVPIEVPNDFRGYDQDLNGTGRPGFFGVLEIPVPYDALQDDNRVTLTFPDSGGYVSTVLLQSFKFSREVQRHQAGQ